MWFDLRTGYDFLYEAARDFAKEVKAVHSTCTLTTAVSLTWPPIYPLPPDFMEIMTEDDYGDKKILLTSGSASIWIPRVSFQEILADNHTTAVALPSRFAVTDNPAGSRIVSTATDDGLNAGGESVLTDAAGAFLTTVSVGDDVINTDEGYTGKVLSITSNTVLDTAMFDISTAQSSYADWTSGNAYIIQPGARYALILDPPPSTAGQTLTVTYLRRPAPVYSDYGSYNFATGYEESLIKYAFWLFKYRDGKPNQGDPLYQVYDIQLRKAKTLHRGATVPKGFSVSFMKR